MWREKETLLFRSTAQNKNNLPFCREPMWSTRKNVKSGPIHDFHYHYYYENIIRLTLRQWKNSMTPTMNLKSSSSKIQSLGTYPGWFRINYYARKGSYAKGMQLSICDQMRTTSSQTPLHSAIRTHILTTKQDRLDTSFTTQRFKIKVLIRLK